MYRDLPRLLCSLLTRLSVKRSNTAPLECALVWLVLCALDASRIWSISILRHEATTKTTAATSEGEGRERGAGGRTHQTFDTIFGCTTRTDSLVEISPHSRANVHFIFKKKTHTPSQNLQRLIISTSSSKSTKVDNIYECSVLREEGAKDLPFVLSNRTIWFL